VVSLLSDTLAWVSIGLFVGGWLLQRRFPDRGLQLAVAAWAVFAVFWLQLVPHFAFVHKSYIEAILAIAAVPASLYTGHLLWSGRHSLLVLSRAVAIMGLIYLPFETIPALAVGAVTLPAPRAVLIETVFEQTRMIVEALGYQPDLEPGDTGLQNTFVFYDGDHRLTIAVVLACTGLGSIAIFAGLIGAVEAPRSRKLRALAIAVPIIYVLNLLRTSFITIMFGNQYMQWFTDEVLMLFGASDPYMVSFFISDRIISQALAVVVLVGLIYVVLRELPELLTIIEDVLFLLTGEDHDLHQLIE
jgi:Predicted membrane protein